MSEGPAGYLCQGLPPYVYDPPIEAVVFGFGVNEDRQLGLDIESNVLAPKVVEALLGTRFRGREFRRSPLVAGSRNTLAVSADGDVYSWGWNARATLGHGHRESELKPRRIAALKGVQIIQVSLGGWHCLALDIHGQMYAWGGNEYAQCGLEPGSLRDIPTPTKCLHQLKVRQVAAGGMHSLALTEDGQIWMWGEPWGDFSMTIDRTPRRVTVEGHFVGIACGAFHNLALNSEGELYTWGINDFGQLGNGTTSYATEPQKVTEGLEGVVLADIAAGGWHSLALSTTGEVYVWGRGEYGRLGLGDKVGSSKLRPTKVKALEGMRIVEGSCGGTHTMVVTDDGRAFIWGRGAFGRLGTGTERDHISPIEVKLPGGPERWRVITGAVGGRHSMVLAVPDNGDLHERSAVWSTLHRRSPNGLTPQGSIRSGTNIYGPGAEGAEADDEAGGEGEESSEGTSAEEEGGPGQDVVSVPLGLVAAGGGGIMPIEEELPLPSLGVTQQNTGPIGDEVSTSSIGNERGNSGTGNRENDEDGADEEDEEEEEQPPDSDDDADVNDLEALQAQIISTMRVHGVRDDAPGDRA